MAVSPWIRTLAQQASRQIRATQAGYEQAESWILDRHPNIDPQHLAEAANGAVDIYHEHLRRNQGNPSDPAVDPDFRDAGWERPGTVMATVRFDGPGETTRYRNFRINVGINATIQDVFDAVDDIAAEAESEYEGSGVGSVSF